MRVLARLRIFYTQHYKLRHRKSGYRFLSGEGLEIGAFYLPALLPRGCHAANCDALSTEQAYARFPEIKDFPLTPVTHLLDLDENGLARLPAHSADFLIMNHVLEHVANPIQILQDACRLIKPDGHLVLAIPDKNYSTDKARALTGVGHLIREYRDKTTVVSDEHYRDFLMAAHPEATSFSPEQWAGTIAQVRRRREHAHV